MKVIVKPVPFEHDYLVETEDEGGTLLKVYSGPLDRCHLIAGAYAACGYDVEYYRRKGEE